MRIGIANDHRGMEQKKLFKEYLEKQGYQVIDYGPKKLDWNDDYPDFAFSLGEALQKGEIDYGILLCRTGIGMSIAANKVKGVRCARVATIQDAILTRKDNNANVIALSYQLSVNKTQKIIHAFLTTDYLLGRHQRRVDKIDRYLK